MTMFQKMLDKIVGKKRPKEGLEENLLGNKTYKEQHNQQNRPEEPSTYSPPNLEKKQ